MAELDHERARPLATPTTPRTPGGPGTGDGGGTTGERRAGAGFIAVYVLALFGSYVAIITPSVVSIALKMQQIDPDGKVGGLSLVLGVGALFAVVANPLFGKLSDRTTSRWGMRRPWLVAGAVGGTLGLLVVATAPNVWLVLVGWCVAQTMFNALLAPLVAILPDQIPASQRGFVGGLLGICYPGGLVLGSWIAQAVDAAAFWMIMAPTGITLVTVGILCAVLHERPLDPADRPPMRLGEFLRAFWFNPARNPDFAWACLSVLLVSTAIMTFVTYQVYYVSDYLRIGSAEVPRLVFLLTLVTNGSAIVTCVVGGWLSDRYRRRRFFMTAAGILTAIGLGALILASSLPGLFTGAAVTGLGMGLFYSGHFALPASVLPDTKDAAKDMGIANIAVTIPSSLVPLYGPALLAIGGTGSNYPALFTSGIVLALVAIPVVRRIRGVR